MAEENPGRQHAHEARISLILFALTLPICLTLLVVSYRDQHNKPISISISSILSFSPWSRRQRIASSQSNNSYGGSIGSSNNTGGALELRKATMYWTAATAIHLIEIATALCHYTDRGWDGRTPLHGSGFYNFPCPPDILWAVGQALEVVTIPVYACKLVLQLTPLAFSRTARRRRRRIERAARVYVYFTAAATISQCINLVLQHLPSFGIPVSEGFLAVTFAIDPIAYAGWEFCLVGLGLVMVYFGALALRMLRITAGRRLQSGTSGSAAEVSGSGALPADSTGTPSGGGGVVAVVNKLAAVGSQSGIAVEPTGKVSVPVQAEAKCSLSVVMLKVGFHHHPGDQAKRERQRIHQAAIRLRQLVRSLQVTVGTFFALVLLSIVVRACQGPVGIQVSWGITIVVSRCLEAFLFLFVRLTRKAVQLVRVLPTGDAGTLGAESWGGGGNGDEAVHNGNHNSEMQSVVN